MMTAKEFDISFCMEISERCVEVRFRPREIKDKSRVARANGLEKYCSESSGIDLAKCFVGIS